jgi:hypothetical protein
MQARPRAPVRCAWARGHRGHGRCGGVAGGPLWAGPRAQYDFSFIQNYSNQFELIR